MSIRGKAYIAGIFEHPARKIQNKSLAQLHAECAKGALEDAGLTIRDVDGYFCSTDAPGGLGGINMIDYMGLTVTHSDSTNTGGSSYLYLVAHAAEAIAAGKCKVALITCAGFGRPGTVVHQLLRRHIQQGTPLPFQSKPRAEQHTSKVNKSHAIVSHQYIVRLDVPMTPLPCVQPTACSQNLRTHLKDERF